MANSCCNEDNPRFPDTVNIVDSSTTVDVANSEGNWRRESLAFALVDGSYSATLDYIPIIDSITLTKGGQVLPYPDDYAIATKVITLAADVFDPLASGTADIFDITYMTTDVVGITVAETGTIATFSTDTLPTGWIECDGATVAQATYADLFTVIGHTYGADPGGGDFILPDLQAQFYDGETLVMKPSMIKI